MACIAVGDEAGRFVGRQAGRREKGGSKTCILLRQKVAGYVCIIDAKAGIAVLSGLWLFGRGIEVLGLRGFGILKDAGVFGILI